jgi:AraC-like DNA-binding protein
MTPIALDWLQIAALLGSAQGIFLTGILATQRRNRTANRLLATAMLAFSIHLATTVYYAAGLEQAFPHFFGVAYPLLLLYGPLIYLYAVTAGDRSRRLRWHDALHFIPFLVVVVWGFPIYLLSGEQKIALYHQLQQGVRPPLMQVVDPLRYLSGISYAVATILFLRRHRARVEDNYSSLEHVNLRWLLRLAGAAAAIWVLATLLQLMQVANHPLLARSDDIVSLAIAVLVYGIGYMAVRQPEILHYATAEHRIPRLGPPGGAHLTPPPPPVAHAEPVAGVAPTARYERSGLTEKEATALKQSLLALMDSERLYQNGDLTLADLADRLDTTPHKLSEILNSQLAQTFYDFVNAYRVREVQRRIADEKSRNLTVLALAMDAGFASKSTFNSVFKKHTGQTPSAYRQALGQ